MNDAELNAACEIAADAAWNDELAVGDFRSAGPVVFKNVYRVAWWTGGSYASELAEPPYTQLADATAKLVSLMDGDPPPPGLCRVNERVFTDDEFDEAREALAVAKGKHPAKAIGVTIALCDLVFWVEQLQIADMFPGSITGNMLAETQQAINRAKRELRRLT